MESTLSATTATATRLLTISTTFNSSSLITCLHRRLSSLPRTQCLLPKTLSRRFSRSVGNGAPTASLNGLLSAAAAAAPPPPWRLPDWFSSRAVHISYAGGGSGGDGRAGGGGGGSGDEGESEGGVGKSTVGTGPGEEGSASSADVIILDVKGMTCGGCAASVKRILESQPQVSSASVNLTTETAVVWPISEVKVMANWKKHLGEALALHLTNCGFDSTLRDSAVDNYLKFFQKKVEEKHARLRESGHDLALSWALCAVCLVGHLSHAFGSWAPWIHAFHSTGFHLSLSLFTLLGPGRQLVVDGLKSLFKGTPNMNTLVGLGAFTSFAFSSLAALIPKLGWKAFFEEPIMLIAFVLLGKNLEQRAKLKASSDMTGLLSILPAKAQLQMNSNAEESGSTVEVPCSSLAVGDRIVVLPGDRIPTDGIVRAGRSTVDESSFTGEPLPVVKLPGAEVTAGSMNLNGTLTVEVRRPGGETVIGDIVRMVEEAQGREAPIQRLADKVAGQFTFGVMALSAATFMFWNLFGAQVLPAIAQQGSPISLALQLSCSVLVVACPCALGLATPTAILVGTSIGATKGLLLRGGNVLEMCSRLTTVVFDKTGTLTVGKPAVIKVMTPSLDAETNSEHYANPTCSEVEVLQLAAGVELNTIHPIGKAIVEAAQAHNCTIVKATDGTFLEEPGSGAVAVVENKKVSVGTLEWVQRQGIENNPFEVGSELNNQTVVYVGVDNKLAGLICIEDQIREDAGHVVKSLREKGIDVYMLSGDKRNTAEYVASAVDIPKEKVISGVKPKEKRNFIRELQKDGNIVAMAGDGINDAAALASCHVGVAMGGGAGAASEASSVVLMQNRLSQLLDALELSKQTMNTVKQNLWWAFGYNIVGIPIAAGMLLPVTGTILTPSIAGALMGLSSLGVMTNSLLLRLKFLSKQRHIISVSQKNKTGEETDIVDQEKGLGHPYTASGSR